MSKETGRRGLLVSKAWIQASVVVFLIGFLILGILAYRSYTADPPIPDAGGRPRRAGAVHRRRHPRRPEGLPRNGLMEYGSIFGHGAYLGPDFTADYLHRAAQLGRDAVRRERVGPARAADDRRLQDQPLRRRQPARSPSATAQAARLRRARGATTRDFFGDPTTQFGLRPDAITDPHADQAADRFFSWSAWAASARRPGPRLLLHEQLAAGAAGRQRGRRRT